MSTRENEPHATLRRSSRIYGYCSTTTAEKQLMYEFRVFLAACAFKPEHPLRSPPLSSTVISRILLKNFLPTSSARARGKKAYTRKSIK